jgi:hypothetical protein
MMIEEFKENFYQRIDLGKEWFEGDEKAMIKIIKKIINEIEDGNAEKLIKETKNHTSNKINTGYECEICKFKKTANHKNYENHCKTIKHKSECLDYRKFYSCKKCKSIFKKGETGDEHSKNCSIKKKFNQKKYKY